VAIGAPQYLIDNSAYNRLKYEADRARIAPLVDGGLVATCGALELEALYSARDPSDYENLWSTRTSIFSYVDTEEADWQQALSVQRELARKSLHRGPKIPDLLIAAVAGRNSLILLHYDSDFERIADITGQPIEWVVPRGSIS
jgi:predicted nucleic acid-binding protein